jgi:murein L,D-transpeptidase YafK
MSSARPAVAGAALAAALALAGCKSEQAVTAKSIQPISAQTVSLMTEKGMTRQDPILLRIYKEEAKAEVWKKRKADGRYALLKSYDICRFSGKLGPKIKEGDKQAPEGFYSVGPAQMNPRSSYYLSFNIGFPNKYDQALGRTGRHVMMHGDCLSAGCYAMTDAQIAEIYALARESFSAGQKSFQVQALPFRMTAQNMARRRNDKNMAFWKNLKQGSDAFEVSKLEPTVDVCAKRYAFNAGTSGDAPCVNNAAQPAIAKAVAAKEKTDNILIAQLSKSEPIAPEYVAQNGRLRRTLDEPIVAVAAVAPEAAGTPLTAQPTSTGSVAVASVSQNSRGVVMGAAPAAPASAQQVALATPVDSRSAAVATAQGKPEGSLFARMFRTGGEDAPATAAAAPTAAAPAQVASARGPAVRPAAREISPTQAPMMASSVGPAAPSSEQPGAVGKLKGWVGGLFGSGTEETAPVAAPPVETVPASYAPPAATPRRNRQANLPESFRTRPAPNSRVASSFAAVE